MRSTITTARYDDGEELVATLHAMNEQGIEPKLSGLDAEGQPFLVQILGPYAERVAVTLNTPWDSEVSYHNTLHDCEECGAQGDWNLDALTFPVLTLSAWSGR